MRAWPLAFGRPLDRVWGDAGTVILVSLAAKLAACAIAFSASALPIAAAPLFAARLSLRWDAGTFLALARFGYHVAMPGLSSGSAYAYAPVFPAVLRLAGAAWFTPVVVSNIAGLGAAAALVPLLGRRAALFFALFPTWVAFSTFGYSESLYVLLAALGFLTYRAAPRPAGALAAGALMAAAVATRYMAGPAVLTFVLASKAPWPRRAWFLAPLAAAALAIAVWLWADAGTPFAYFHAERAQWGVRLGWPWEQAWWFLHLASAGGGSVSPWAWLARQWVAAAISASGCWLLWRDDEHGLAAFSLVVVVLTLCLVGTPSGPRLLLAGFPAIAALGTRLRPAAAWAAYAGASVLVSAWIIVAHLTRFFA
jgi:hypothetical protein